MCQQDYFTEKHRVAALPQIPTCFEKCNFHREQSFQFRVTRIYDPTKFWIVTKVKELEVFQQDLFKYYYMNRGRYRMPEDKLELDSYCVVFVDSGYYRGIIVGFTDDTQKKQAVQIYFIDYGLVQTVESQNVFYLSQAYAQVPQFVVRASLAGICPRTRREWSDNDSIAFGKVVNDKLLIGVVVAVDDREQVLEIRCSAEGVPVDETLIKQKRARYWDEKADYQGNSSLLPKHRFQFLFPCHEALEGGKVPLTIADFDYLKDVSPHSSIVTRYYTEAE